MGFTPEQQAIYEKALRYCSQAEHCRSQVGTKLRQWGAESVVAKTLLDKLQEEGFLDEDRFAELFVRSKVRQNSWGRNKILYALRSNGVVESSIRYGLEALDENIYQDVLLDVLKKAKARIKESDSRAKEQKVIAYAVSKGFEIDLIKRLYAEMLK